MGLRTWLGLKTPPRPSGQSPEEARERPLVEGAMPPSFPIDAVYTWVDGDDPAFLDRRRAWLGDRKPPDGNAGSPSRWQDHHELKYSLRSIAAYAPWVRHIHVVTNGQTPGWLASHPKLSMVTHDEILAPEYLPTFNSHVIESALHRIPGLSEHYLYFNDDVLLLRAMAPDDFFTGNGLMYGFLAADPLPQGPVSEDDLPSIQAAKNSLHLIQREWGVWPARRFKHTALPQRRSVAEDSERLFDKEIDECRRNRFRAINDVACCTYLNANVAYLTARGLLRRNRTRYVRVQAPEAAHAFRQMLADKQNGRALDTVCLNDDPETTGPVPDYRDRLHRFLEAYFPVVSEFESARLTAAPRSCNMTQPGTTPGWKSGMPVR